MKQLIGRSFGMLTVIALSEIRKYTSVRNTQTKAYWLCSCECGNEKVVRGEHLTSGSTVSCGCAAREKASARLQTHGLTSSPEYRSWANMRSRTHNPDVHHKKYYDGISVAKRWDNFKSFLEDMGEKPTPNHEIDRIDPLGDYEPSNCRWATRSEQMLNQRRNTGFYAEYLSLDPIVPYAMYKQRVKAQGCDKAKAAKTPKMKNQFV